MLVRQERCWRICWQLDVLAILAKGSVGELGKQGVATSRARDCVLVSGTTTAIEREKEKKRKGAREREEERERKGERDKSNDRKERESARAGTRVTTEK